VLARHLRTTHPVLLMMNAINELHRHTSCLKPIALHDMLWAMSCCKPCARCATTHPEGTACPAAQSSKLQSRQGTFAFGAAAGLAPTLQRRRTRASLRACNWDPLPSAPLVLLDGPYAAPAMRWEVRSLHFVTAPSRSSTHRWCACSPTHDLPRDMEAVAQPQSLCNCKRLCCTCMHEACAEDFKQPPNCPRPGP
jgi:hypothetical protein